MMLASPVRCLGLTGPRDHSLFMKSAILFSGSEIMIEFLSEEWHNSFDRCFYHRRTLEVITAASDIKIAILNQNVYVILPLIPYNSIIPSPSGDLLTLA